MNIPIIDMGKTYPFDSGSKNIEECSNILVHKQIIFASEKEKEMIQQFMHFVKSVNHPNIINLVNTTIEPNTFHFYYQYVPLKLEPWILGVNDQLSQDLEEQLLQLIQFLTRSNIYFKFDPNSVGLTHDMKVKYFLNQFTLEVQNQDKNCKELQQSVKTYIQQLRKQAGLSEKSKQIKSTRLGSVSTNGSISHLQQYKTLSKSQCKESQSSKKAQQDPRYKKMQQLYQKAQTSKQKSMEILLKLKSINRNKTEKL